MQWIAYLLLILYKSHVLVFSETCIFPLSIPLNCTANITKNNSTTVCIQTFQLDLPEYCDLNRTLNTSCSVFDQDPCVACHEQCDGCFGSSNGECIQCVNVTSSKKCVSQCPDNTVLNITANTCEKCNKNECIFTSIISENVNSTQPATTKEPHADITNLLIGCIIGGLAGVILITTIMSCLVIKCRNRKKDKASRTSDSENSDYFDPDSSTVPKHFDNDEPEDQLPTKPKPVKLTDQILQTHDRMNQYIADPTAKFKKFSKKKKSKKKSVVFREAWKLRTVKDPLKSPSQIEKEESTDPPEQEDYVEQDPAHPQELYQNVNVFDNPTKIIPEQEIYENVTSKSSTSRQETHENPKTRHVGQKHGGTFNNVSSMELREIEHLPPAPVLPSDLNDEHDEVYGNMSIVNEHSNDHQELYGNMEDHNNKQELYGNMEDHNNQQELYGNMEDYNNQQEQYGNVDDTDVEQELYGNVEFKNGQMSYKR